MNWSRRLHEPFVSAALLIALSAGFGYGALLVAARAFGAPLGAWYSALVQAHGHAQLFGWVGMFVLGMGLYFLPRLRGTNLKGIARLPYAFGLLVTGIVVRSVVQPLMGFVGTNEILRGFFLLSALLELAGMVIVVSILLETERHERALSRDAPAYPVEPFAQMAFLSLALAFVINLLGVWNLASESKNALAPRYDQFIITLFLYGAAIPMTLVFSLRNLPLFLRLAIPSRGIWRPLAMIYFVGLALRVSPFVLAILDDALLLTGRLLRANFINVILLDALAVLGALVLNACILIWVWNLDLLRLKKPWTAERMEVSRPDLAHLRKPTRANYPDNGEYGRFELLIYSAFAWLVVATLMDLLRALPVINELILIPQDAARHALMLGFITLLIFGMAVRMVPGFSGKRRLAYPRLVTWLFVLGNLAALLRVAPLFFAGAEWATWLWGISGLMGWCAVLVLAIVLWRTSSI